MTYIPKNADPLFCTFDRPISEYIRRVSGFCIYLYPNAIRTYDLRFCFSKEVWIFYLHDGNNNLLTRFAYALLRRGATKVQIQCFPVEEKNHE